MEGFWSLLDRLSRTRLLLVFLVIAAITIGLLAALLGKNTPWGVLVLDFSSNSPFRFPFTIQNLMLILFFLGIGDLLGRAAAARREMSYLKEELLPEDDETVIGVNDLGGVRRRIHGRHDSERGFLLYLLNVCILQIQANRSIEQAVSVLNSSLDLLNHRVDLRYQLIRYLVWVIPTIGFIGTVVGIAQALGYVNPEHMDIKLITGSLGIAFNTTIVALALSALLVFCQSGVQKYEETALNLAGDYCLKNLINRLYIDD